MPMISTTPRSPNAAIASLKLGPRAAACGNFAADAVDELFVGRLEHRRAAGADRLDRGCRHPRLLGERGMRIPFVLRPPEPRGRDDRQLGQPVGQRGAPAQILAERRRVPANSGSADQQLKRAAEPAALAGDDLVVDALLRRVHLGGGDLAVTAHGWFPCCGVLAAAAYADPACGTSARSGVSAPRETERKPPRLQREADITAN